MEPRRSSQGPAIHPRKSFPFFLRRRFISRSAAIVLAAWACLLILPELYRVGLDLSSLGISVNSNGVIVGVTYPFASPGQSPAAQAGIAPGDRIDMRRMRCTDPRAPVCASLVTVMGDLGELEYTRANVRAPFDILSETGVPRRVTVRAAVAPLPWLSRVILLAGTIVGVIFVAVAFFLVWTRPSRMSWGFFLYSLWFNPGQNYTLLALLQAWPAALLAEQFLEAAVQGAANAGLLMFAVRFPTGAITLSWRLFERAIPWIGVLITAFSMAAAANLFGIPAEIPYELTFAAGFAVDAAAIIVLLLRLMALHPQDEQRMLWAIAGCVIGIPSFIIAELCQSTSLPADILGFNPPQSVPGLLYLLQGVMAYFVGTAIYRRRVVSVGIPLRRGATLTFLTFLLGVPILYLHEQITLYTQRRDLPAWLWPLVIGPIVLLILARLQDIAAELTERIFNRRYHRARVTLQKAGQTIQNASGFAEIDAALTEAPAGALRLASVAVFRTIGNQLHRVGPAIGWTDSQLRIIDPQQHSAWVTQFLQGKPIALPRNENMWDRPNMPRDDLYPCLAVPIHGGVSESIAVILCGPHLSGADISYDERQLLRDFASRAALSYDRVEANHLRQEIETLRNALNNAQREAKPPP